MRFVYTPWDLVWRIAYPIVCCLQVITQLWTIWIHYKLTCKSRKDFQQRRTILALNSQVDNRDNILRLNAEMFTHNSDSYIVIENSRNMQELRHRRKPSTVSADNASHSGQTNDLLTNNNSSSQTTMDIVPQRQTKRTPILVIVSHIVALIIYMFSLLPKNSSLNI
jgi:hypothetical protein